MARRVRLLEGQPLAEQLDALSVPTLIVTGEPHLDRVVPVEATRQYLEMCPHAETATLSRTGHLGSITRPDEFARVVTPFVRSASYQEQERRRIV
jgi:pimeloyl-ACP methyl ester carboxylesterase